MDPEINKYQIAGLDERGRSFNRLAEVIGSKSHYDASLLYETSRFKTEKHPSEVDALNNLIGILHEKGFRELRCQLSFKDNVYLGSNPEWTEYPDPVVIPKKALGFTQWLKSFFQPP